MLAYPTKKEYKLLVESKKHPILLSPMKLKSKKKRGISASLHFQVCDGTSSFFQKGTPAVNLSRHAEKAAPGNPTGSIPTQNRPIALTLIHAD